MSKATLAVRDVGIGTIKPYAKNPRKNEAAVAKVAASIKEFGWRQPIVVDEDMVVLAGHTRLLAAKRLGMATVPVHVALGLSPAQRRAFRLADNRSGAEAEWDDALLAEEIAALLAEGADLSTTGFDPDEISRLTADVSKMLEGFDPDEEIEPPADPVSRPGDLYQLGRHRVLCGDSTVATDVGRLLDGAKPRLMVTDPPYGVDYDANWRNEADRATGKPYGASAVGLVANDGKSDWTEAWALFTGDVVYCWHADRHASTVQRSLEDAGFEMRSQIIWAKTRMIISRGHYHWQHEPCWYAFRKGATAGWIGDRSQTTLWMIAHGKSDTGHSTQKPVEAMRRPIHNHEGDVYDPFLGSGTTLIAAEMEGRTCYGMELMPAYVDVIVQRWEKATGQKAKLVRAE